MVKTCCKQSTVMDKFHATIQHANFTKFRDYVLQTFGPNYHVQNTLPKSSLNQISSSKPKKNTPHLSKMRDIGD